MKESGNQDFNALLEGYHRETLTKSELVLFFDLASQPENALLLGESFVKDLQGNMTDISSKAEAGAAFEKLQQKINIAPKRQGKLIQHPLRWVAAASVLLLVAVGIYKSGRQHPSTEDSSAKSGLQQPGWLSPAHVGATLILTGGDSIVLNDQDKGVIATQGTSQVIQSGGGIGYKGEIAGEMMNEIRTGSGKLWQLRLPDGTSVWLNANSSIKYPVSFHGKIRFVEVTGELYFKVEHDAGKPFRVKAGTQLVEDVGTSFNIDAYPKSNSATTTVVTGSVNVNSEGQKVALHPGEQSFVSASNHTLEVNRNVNLEKALAWKNGRFYFENDDLETVMKQIADWYQVDVRFEGPVAKGKFTGQIEKSLSISQVLLGLRQPGIDFKMEDSIHVVVVTS
jgi:transmembrane sensor